MAATQKNRPVSARDKQTAGCIRRKPSEAEKRPAGRAADAFLSQTFSSMLKLDGTEVLGDQDLIEQSFFKSLENMAALYKWPLKKIVGKGRFPDNIINSYENAKKRLSKSFFMPELCIINSDDQVATLATVVESIPERQLYYIPVKFYWQLLRSNQRPEEIELVAAVFSYLLRIAGISYFTDDFGGYLSYQLDIIRQEVTEDEHDPEREAHDEWVKCMREEIRQVEAAAEECLRTFEEPVTVDDLEECLKNFVPIDATDKKLAAAAAGILEVYRENPERPLDEFPWLNIHEESHLSQWGLSCLVSFFWTDDDQLYDNFRDSINSDFGEGEPELPKSVQLFDTPQMEVRHDMSFSNKLIGAITDLIDYLYSLNEKYRATVNNEPVLAEEGAGDVQ